MEEQEDNAIYKVVVNHEEQYSLAGTPGESVRVERRR
jgi:uncharacterized protein YbdZ (MbtH family)